MLISKQGKWVDGDARETKASVSHDRAIVRELRENLEFATEYVQTASEDHDKAKVLLSTSTLRRGKWPQVGRYLLYVFGGVKGQRLSTSFFIARLDSVFKLSNPL